MQLPKVSIIIVNYNGKTLLEKCLESVFKIDYKNTEVIVVDNNSTDDTVEFVTNNYPSMCVGLIIRTLPPHLLWLGCIFFVEFIELKKCVHHFCVHYLITIDWI